MVTVAGDANQEASSNGCQDATGCDEAVRSGLDNLHFLHGAPSNWGCRHGVANAKDGSADGSHHYCLGSPSWCWDADPGLGSSRWVPLSSTVSLNNT